MAQILKNTFIYSASNVITSLSGFILLPIYAKFLSVAEYGIISSMQTLSAVLIIFISLGLERSLFRIYYDYDNEIEQKEFLGTVFIGIVIASSFILIICYILKSSITKLFPSVPFFPYYTYTIGYAFLMVFINFGQTIAQVKQKALRFFLTSVFIFSLSSSLNLLLIIKFKYGAIGYVKGLFFGIMISLPFVIFYIFRSIKIRFRMSKFKAALRFSLPMFPTLLSGWILSLSDRVFVDNFFGTETLGIYSLGYKIASIIIFLSSAIFMAYNPLFFNIANSNDAIKTQKAKLFNYNNDILMTIGLISIALLLSADVVIRVLFNKQYISAQQFIPLLTLSFFINQITGLFNLMVYQTKKTAQVTLIVFLSALVNIFLNYFFLEQVGPIGAAYSTLICSILTFLLMFLMGRKNYYINFNWLRFLLLLSFLFIVYLENIIIDNRFNFYAIIIIKTTTYIAMLLPFNERIRLLLKNLNILKS